MFCLADGQSRGAHPRAVILTSTDGGTSWTADSVPARAEDDVPTGEISCVAQECWMAAESNTLVHASDGGRHFAVEALPDDAYAATDVVCLNSKLGYATGGVVGCGSQGATYCDGAVYKSTDGGKHWHIVVQHIPDVVAISCIDESHCWAAAKTFTTGRMYGTADGGAKWNRQAVPKFAGAFSDIRCVQRSGDRCLLSAPTRRPITPWRSRPPTEAPGGCWTESRPGPGLCARLPSSGSAGVPPDTRPTVRGPCC